MDTAATVKSYKYAAIIYTTLVSPIHESEVLWNVGGIIGIGLNLRTRRKCVSQESVGHKLDWTGMKFRPPKRDSSECDNL
jgi:hypothetical protein